VTRAELIAANRYMVLSTADADGRPWASPVWFAPHGDDAFLWISRPDTRHSLNIAVRPEVAIVIFDSSRPPEERQALYVDALAAEAEPELIAIYSKRSVAHDLREFTVAEVSPPEGVFRVYRAVAGEQWMLEDERDRRIPAL
jgi:putative heme iron utilization protein